MGDFMKALERLGNERGFRGEQECIDMGQGFAWGDPVSTLGAAEGKRVG